MAETMGQIIRRLRRDMDLTQEELAERLNISAPAVSKWENGTSMPDISQIVPLANLFGVSTDVLFGTAGKNDAEEVKRLLSEIFTIYDNTKDGEEAKNGLVLMDKYREAIRLYPNNTTILNNAAAFPRLESDATAAYAIHVKTGKRPEKIVPADLEVDSPYNTYKNDGLPPGAISSPGYDAIVTAMYPAKTSYYYFYTKSDKRTVFSKTLAEHQAAIRADTSELPS